MMNRTLIAIVAAASFAAACSSTRHVTLIELSSEIESACLWIDHNIEPQLRGRFVATDEVNAVVESHFGVGLRVRNELLANGSSLMAAFTERGVRRRDDASSIILTVCHRRANDRAPGLDQLVDQAVAADPRSVMYSALTFGECSTGDLQFIYAVGNTSSSNAGEEIRQLSYYVCPRDRGVWQFRTLDGWTPAAQSVREEVLSIFDRTSDHGGKRSN